jgi:hypothetical protein
MEKILILTVTLSVIGLNACSHSDLDREQLATTPVKIDASATAEVRAVLVNIVAVSKLKDEPAFRKLILPQAVAAFDANQSDYPGFYQNYMAAIASIKPRDYDLTLEGNRADFRGFRKGPIATSPERVEIALVHDGSTWKIGSAPTAGKPASAPHPLQPDAPKQLTRSRHKGLQRHPRSKH